MLAGVRGIQKAAILYTYNEPKHLEKSDGGEDKLYAIAEVSERKYEREGGIESARNGEEEKDHDRKKRERKEKVNGRSRGGGRAKRYQKYLTYPGRHTRDAYVCTARVAHVEGVARGRHCQIP
eukprot:6207913-Pleurochrysis_carterae.AAC.1